MTPEPERQVWEQRITGTDVPLTRIILTVEEDGRVRVHEALLGRLLLDAGWERADLPHTTDTPARPDS